MILGITALVVVGIFFLCFFLLKGRRRRNQSLAMQRVAGHTPPPSTGPAQTGATQHAGTGATAPVVTPPDVAALAAKVAAKSKLWSFLFKILLTVAVLATVAVSIFLLWPFLVALGIWLSSLGSVSYTPPNLGWNMPERFDWVTAGLSVAAIIAIGVTLLLVDKNNKKKLGTYLFVTVMVLLVFGLYKYGVLEVGYRREVLYLLAIAALILVATYATPGKEKFTFGVLVGALFVMLGTSHIFTWDQFTSKLTPSNWGTVALNGGRCTEKVIATTLSTQAEELNKNGECYLRLHEQVRGHCVDVHDRWGTYLGNDCAGNANFDGRYGAKYAASARGNATVVPIIYVLCNRRGSTNTVADGCP